MELNNGKINELFRGYFDETGYRVKAEYGCIELQRMKHSNANVELQAAV